MKVKNIMLCATAVVPSLAWAKELPNIIYIVTDQQTASAMSCICLLYTSPSPRDVK